jgi:hypothetical protein
LISTLLERRPWAGISLPDDWEFIVVGLVILFAFVWWLRGVERKRLLRLALIWLWVGGMALMVWVILFRLQPDWLPDNLFWPMSRWAAFVAEDRPLVINLLAGFYVLAANELWEAAATLQFTPQYLATVLVLLALVYPLEMAFALSRLFTLPYGIFYKALTWMVPSIRLRWRIGQALARQERRNREQVKGDFRATVCREHLLRFVSSRERRSYLRTVVYYHCPTCQEDNEVYNGVRCLALLFSQSMTEPVRQQGPNLYLNGLHWLERRGEVAVPVFDVLVVADVDPPQVEAFVTEYQNREQQLRPPHKRLRRIHGHIAANAPSAVQLENLLKANLARLSTGFEIGDGVNACSGSPRPSRIAHRATADATN